MSLIGRFQVKIVLQIKYDFNFSIEDIDKNVKRLTNQLWKLIPMKENSEDWKKQLNTVTLEIAGLNEIFLQSPLFLQLLGKLEGLNIKDDIHFDLYRKTVFEAINLLQEISRESKI